MTKQATIRDEDYDLAHEIAGRLGASLDDTVTKALRDLDRRTVLADGLDADQQAESAAIRALVEEARGHVLPKASNDHGWLYDWNGLPACDTARAAAMRPA